jgi:hypothetical protein
MAKRICNKLGLEYGKPSYYRAIHVWLPDERWGAVSMPPCVNCKSADKVSLVMISLMLHAERRVLSVDTHYYVMSQRYICHTCEGESKKAKNQQEMAAASHNLRLVDDVTTSCDRYVLTYATPILITRATPSQRVLFQLSLDTPSNLLRVTSKSVEGSSFYLGEDSLLFSIT